MTKSQLINLLISQRKCKKYLEIGFKDRYFQFDKVCCAYKVGVGQCAGATYTGSSDDFFSLNREKFDLILVDGDHEEEQASRDISNALRSLAPGGVIVIHDCMPPDAWHQRDASEYVEGENWNGTVWKAALRLFNKVNYKCTLVDMDWGCGIIDTSQSQVPLSRQLPAYLEYDQHFSILLGYKCSVAHYLRPFVKVFFHIACMHNWKLVFEEIMQQLHRNGFNNIKLTVLGSDEDMEWVLNTSRCLNIEVEVIFHENELTNFEKPAILAIESFARQNDGYVLYLHSKGVSNPDDAAKAKWRRLMLSELVANWEFCMAQLPEYDAIGVNWREMPPVSHFCGNFWYASTQYLRKLADFNQYYDNPRYKIWDSISAKRLGCEFWIGSALEKPTVLSLAYKNVDFCNAEFWRTKHIPEFATIDCL